MSAALQAGSTLARCAAARAEAGGVMVYTLRVQGASAQFLGQPDTAILTLAGVHEPHMNFSMRMPKPVESCVPKRHQSEPTQVFTVLSPLA